VPFTHTVPKILVPIRGRPLLARQLEYLAANGVREVAINVHHHAEQVIAALAEPPPPVHVHISTEARLLGTAGALVPFREYLDEPFLVLYGDVVTDADLTELARAHGASRSLATLAYYRSTSTAGKGTIEIDGAGRVQRFTEKGSPPGESLVNAGLYVMQPRILQYVVGDAPDFGHDVWPRALAAGEEVRGWELTGYIRDIGSPAALAAVEQDLAQGRLEW
jgi:NDP-sugar pyrophosphorylase family protein